MSMQNNNVPEQQLPGIQKPPIKHVFKRRGKKQQVTNDEAINKSPSNKLDKGVSPESGKAKMIEAPINYVEKKMSEQSSKTDRAQFKNTTTIMIEDRFKGIPKPPIIHVYKRRGKKEKGIEAISKSPSETN